MTPTLFISYRRDDTAGFTRALFNALESRFGGGVFMDVDTLAPGDDFVDAIERAVGACEVVLAVIGPQWAVSADGRARLAEDNDYVRLELEIALKRGITIIPILVESTPMPGVDSLPDSLLPLLRRNALSLSNARFAADLDRLASALPEPAISQSGSAVDTDAVTAPKPARSHLLWLAVAVGLVGLGIGLWLLLKPADTPTASATDGGVAIGGSIEAQDGGVVVVSSGPVTVNQADPEVALIVAQLQRQVESQSRLLSVSQARQVSFRQRSEQTQQQVSELKQAVLALQAQGRDQTLPEELRAASQQALRDLAKGETQPAESVFAAVETRAVAEADVGQAAAAARFRGAMAFLHDTDAALDAYQRATELDPEDPAGWNGLGHLLLRLGRLDDAGAAYRRVTEIGRDSNDRAIEAAGYGNLGHVYEAQGDLREAAGYYHRALDVALVLAEAEGLAHAYNNLGNVYREQGELTQANDMLSRSLELYQSQGLQPGIAAAASNLGSVNMMMGDLGAAEGLYQQALELSEELGDAEAAANAYGNLGLLYLESGDPDLAEAMHRKSLELEEDLGHKAGVAKDLGNLAVVHLARGELDQAEQLSRRALALEQELGQQAGIAAGHSRLGLVLYMGGQLDEAESNHRQALEIDRRIDNPVGLARDHSNLGIVAADRGDADQAREEFGTAVGLYRSLGDQQRADELCAWIAELGAAGEPVRSSAKCSPEVPGSGPVLPGSSGQSPS